MLWGALGALGGPMGFLGRPWAFVGVSGKFQVSFALFSVYNILVFGVFCFVFLLGFVF